MAPVEVAWWLWVVVGLILLVFEVLTPGGFFILFFGVGALAVGVLKVMGIALPLAGEILVFVVLSVIGLVAFRQPLLRRFRQLTPNITVDSFHGESAVALEDIAAGGGGKVELRGTAWNAHNLGDSSIGKSSVCKVERVEGLTLFVRGN
jgi:inner membrane protein